MNIGILLPAMGYGEQQAKDLEAAVRDRGQAAKDSAGFLLRSRV